jgi:hypothetical protein
VFTPACVLHFSWSFCFVAERQFYVFVTIDRKLEHQIDLRRFAQAFVMVRVTSNTLAAYLPSFDRLRRTVETVRKGEVVHLDARTGH